MDIHSDTSNLSDLDPHENTTTTCTAEQSEIQSSKSYPHLAKDETRAVNASKLMVISSLVVAACVVGTLMYHFLSRHEQKFFKTHFHNFALEVSDLVHAEARDVFLAVEGLANTVTSLALATNRTWPYVTVPHFEIQGTQANALSKSVITAFCPLIHHSTKTQWEAYSANNQGWIQESLQYNINMHKNSIGKSNYKAKAISEKIFNLKDGKQVYDDDQFNHKSPHLPVWQIAPAPYKESVVNYDVLSQLVFEKAYHRVTTTLQPALSEITELAFLYERSNMHAEDHPHSFLLYPIYNNFNVEHVEKDIVAFLVAVLPWNRYFEHILTKDTHEVTVVLEDTRNQIFTFLIKGPSAYHIGPGDLHDCKYDDFVFETKFAFQNSLSPGFDFGEFVFRIYPTSTLEFELKTNQPLLFTVGVQVVFFFTSMAFVLYDHLVQYRQNKVAATAQRSGAIVSSLFPSNVRDRVMMDAEKHVEDKIHASKDKHFPLPKTRLMSFLANDKETVAGDLGKPIADLFPSATVLYADIVGFTKWCSVREPTQVFQLLETIYHAFDEHGRRRGCFKIETIGDCYVAVAGLPVPRQDHAVVMARFARDCLSTMNDLVKELDVTLGPGTNNLSMRFGLNSGQVTAGVLRGAKARFQLFGESVNIAALMESTGERNKIQVAQGTADLLQLHGKSHWVLPRKDKIVVKGKGELQTYWLNMKFRSSPSLGSGSTVSGYALDKSSSNRCVFHG